MCEKEYNVIHSSAPSKVQGNSVTRIERILPSCVKCVFVMESRGVKLSDSKGPLRRLCSGTQRQHTRLVSFPLKKSSFHPRTQHCDTHDESIWTTLTFTQVLSSSVTKKGHNFWQPTFTFYYKPLYYCCKSGSKTFLGCEIFVSEPWHITYFGGCHWAISYGGWLAGCLFA